MAEAMRVDGGDGRLSGPMKPTQKPQNPNFSSGPCSKRPGYSLAALPTDILGRSASRARKPSLKTS